MRWVKQMRSNVSQTLSFMYRQILASPVGKNLQRGKPAKRKAGDRPTISHSLRSVSATSPLHILSKILRYGFVDTELMTSKNELLCRILKQTTLISDPSPLNQYTTIRLDYAQTRGSSATETATSKKDWDLSTRFCNLIRVTCPLQTTSRQRSKRKSSFQIQITLQSTWSVRSLDPLAQLNKNWKRSPNAKFQFVVEVHNPEFSTQMKETMNPCTC